MSVLQHLPSKQQQCRQNRCLTCLLVEPDSGALCAHLNTVYIYWLCVCVTGASGDWQVERERKEEAIAALVTSDMGAAIEQFVQQASINRSEVVARRHALLRSKAGGKGRSGKVGRKAGGKSGKGGRSGKAGGGHPANRMAAENSRRGKKRKGEQKE